jgi:hypothetical protein
MNPHASKLLRPITIMFIVTSIVGTAVAAAEPYKDALAAWRRGEYATAYRLWQPLADEGDPDAQFYLGFMNEYGLGVWSHGIVVHCIMTSGGTSYGANSSR